MVSPNGRKIVVSGGTGFIGRRLVEVLAARGDEVVVLTRSARQADGNGRVRFVIASGDDAVRREIDGAAGIVNLAGAGVMDERWSDARLTELRESRTAITGKLARAAASARVPVMVSASAVGIYGMREDDLLIDDDTDARGARTSGKVKANDPLAAICDAWEAAADPARAGGVRVCHPRIGIVLGTDGGALASMLPPFKAMVGGPVGSGKQWFSWIHKEDLVAALVFALDEARLTGSFNATAPHPVTMDDFAHALGHALHRPAAIRTPGFAVKLALGERADAVLTGQRVVPSKLETLGFAFRFPVLASALADLFAGH